jgi:hypothetical protein
LRSKVKVPQRSLWYATHCLMVMHPHTNYHWSISKDKNVMARTRKYYLKNNYWPWGQRSRFHKGHYGTRHTILWSCTYELSVNEQFCWIYLNYLTLRSKVIVVHDTPPYGHAPTYLSLTYLKRQKCNGPDKKILFKKQLFDLKVKVPWRSLRYVTHRLMVMHIRTICPWTVLLDLF